MGKLSFICKRKLSKTYKNFSSNVANGKVYAVLLKSITNGKCDDSPLNQDKPKRCEQVIQSADTIGAN